MSEPVSVVLCTAPAAEAERLASRLVESRLAACVSRLGPLQSTYRWEGRIEAAEETLLLIKTAKSCVPELVERLREWHSYDVPEVLELEVASGLVGYLDWVRGSVG